MFYRSTKSYSMYIAHFTKYLALVVIAVFSAITYANAQSNQNGTGVLSIDGYGFDDRINFARTDTLRFITSYDYPPFVFVRRDGRLGGWDIELAQNLCRMLQRKCTVQQVPFDQLGTMLVEGKADIGISGLKMSGAVEDLLDFTEPYLRQGGRFVVRTAYAGSAFTKQNITGLRLGVTAGTQHERFIKTHFPTAVTIPFPHPQDARKALSGRQIDAVFGDAMSLSFWLNGRDSADCCKFLNDAYLLPEFFGDGIAMAVKDGESDLIAALNASLARMARDGVLSALYLKYFPLSYM